MKQALTFDNVALIPQFNNVASRTEPDLSTQLVREGTVKMDIPILAANMDTVIGPELARLLIKRGSVPIFHRFTDFETKLSWVKEFGVNMFLSVGIPKDGKTSGDLADAYKIMIDEGFELGGLCLDVAHGHSLSTMRTLELIRKDFPIFIYHRYY